MKYQRSSDSVFHTEVDAGVALLEPTSNTYYLLNATGSVVWSILEDRVTIDDICNAVAERFDVTKDQCKKDVVDLVEIMRRKGFVVSREEPID